MGSLRRQTETLPEDEEDSLWAKVLLGDNNPRNLLDTVVFYIYYFVLRSGKEHWQLRCNTCRIEVVEHPGERPFLRYTDV